MSDRPKITMHELRQRTFRADLKNLLQTSAAFRRFVWTILSEARIFYPATAGTSHETTINVGRQSLGLEVLHMLKHAEPSVLAILEQEGDLLAEDVKRAAVAPHPGETDDDREHP